MARITLVPSSNSASPGSSRVHDFLPPPSTLRARCATHNRASPSTIPSQDAFDRFACVQFPSLLHSLPRLSTGKIKRALASSSSSTYVCVIIESRRNRISHGNRDGRYRRWILYFDCLLTSVFFSGIIKWKKKEREKGSRGEFCRLIENLGLNWG